MRKILSSHITATLIALSPVALAAQSLWLDRSHDKTLTLEVLRPGFKNEDDTYAKSSNSGWVLFLSSRVPLSKTAYFVGELPFAYGSYEYQSHRSNFQERETETTIGNPYLGIEIEAQYSPVFAQIGVRLPLTPEDNLLGALTGLISDVDRLEAFLPNTTALNFALKFRQEDKPGFSFGLGGGTTFLFNTKGNGSDDDFDFLIGYSAQAGYNFRQLKVITGVTGRAILTQESANYGERSFHQFGLNASLGLGKLRPGLQLRLPLDNDLKSALDFVMGFSLGVRL